jgi:uncharacterized protein YjbI with pentapeptide repeats
MKWRIVILSAIAIILVLGVGALIFAGYWFDWDWTGFNASVGPRVQQYQPEKTLWDWLQLLIIPAGLTLFAFWYNSKQQQATEQRAQIESDRALEFQRQTTLQTYIDRMSELLLEKDMDTIKQDTKLLAVMRARTLTALVALDASRKTSVFEFLYSIGLIHVVYLAEADFSGASMNGANLREIKFRKVNLSGANLRSITLAKADLMNADLSGANLSRSDLFETELTGANLSGADLSDAILDRANLNDADLRGATYTNEQLSKVAYREKLKT